jgi:hypothetical protein
MQSKLSPKIWIAIILLAAIPLFFVKERKSS